LILSTDDVVKLPDFRRTEKNRCLDKLDAILSDSEMVVVSDVAVLADVIATVDISTLDTDVVFVMLILCCRA
jgi:hypothetical protein